MSKKTKSKFDFYEVVKIITDDPKYAEVNGKEGAILGMAQNSDGIWGYAVEIFDEIDGWSFPEDALVTLGYKMKREDFYTGETIRVEVDPVTGEGKISDV